MDGIPEVIELKVEPEITGEPVLKDILFTTYNPEVGQTDSTPCVAGGTSMNVCKMAESGERPIALSQELVAWSTLGKIRKGLNCGKGCLTFEAGDKIILESEDKDPRCNGEFTVSDTLNARFRNRGDIFMLDRKDNISCRADVYQAQLKSITSS